MDDKINQLKDIIEQSNKIVFFGGAGISTESGIPDFRSDTGLYAKKFAYPAETMLSHSYFMTETEAFYEFYRECMIFTEAQPNIAHKKLAALEQSGKLQCVITQNIDGLHQMAGSKKVLELHGSIHRNFCMKCGKFYPLDYIIASANIPLCQCGHIVKPDVVLYEEGLNAQVMAQAVDFIRFADTLIIGGTSLAVYPAAGLLDYFNGSNLVVINKSPTNRDQQATVVLSDSIAHVLSQAVPLES